MNDGNDGNDGFWDTPPRVATRTIRKMTMKKWITLDNSMCCGETEALPGSAEAENTNKKMTDAENGDPGLQNVIYGILLQTAREIEAGGRWQATSEVREVEMDINRTFAAVIAGERTVEDFRAVCRRWKEAGTR
jgi:hypothetical protein